MKLRLISLLLFITIVGSALCQTQTQSQTVGLFLNDTTYAFQGYTLFAPKHNSMTYLINNEGKKCHEWSASAYPPGQSVYLLENGHLLRTCMIQGGLGSGGGEGGRLEEYTWDDNLVWEFNYSTNNYTQHHDVKKLPNGNIIMLVVEKKLMADVLAAGFDPSKFQPDIQQKGYMLPDCIIEVAPIYPSGGTVVWEWHVWDHLIQDFDATKNNYGVVNQHAELVDCDGDHRQLPCFWNHMNCIDYNPAFDEIAVSVRGNSEVWVIDHSTTTLQSAGHSGGTHGKGGDLLYRWGNPVAYGAGNMNSQKYFEQHDVEWVKPDCPGAGNFTAFNNGVNRNYSSIDEFTPPVDVNGNYSYTPGNAFGPANLAWTYVATPPESLFAHDISGAQRVQNGNTLICNGPVGTFIEVTPAGQVVWKYVNPTASNGPLCQGDSIPHDSMHPEETTNSVFRVYRYPPSYTAFTGKDLTPGATIECYHTGVENMEADKGAFTLYQNIPNPFQSGTTLKYKLNQAGKVEINLYDLLGRRIQTLISRFEQAGEYSIALSSSLFTTGNGIYYCRMNFENEFATIKLVSIK